MNQTTAEVPSVHDRAATSASGWRRQPLTVGELMTVLSGHRRRPCRWSWTGMKSGFDSLTGRQCFGDRHCHRHQRILTWHGGATTTHASVKHVLDRRRTIAGGAGGSSLTPTSTILSDVEEGPALLIVAGRQMTVNDLGGAPSLRAAVQRHAARTPRPNASLGADRRHWPEHTCECSRHAGDARDGRRCIPASATDTAPTTARSAPFAA